MTMHVAKAVEIIEHYIALGLGPETKITADMRRELSDAISAIATFERSVERRLFALEQVASDRDRP